jgi:hypothetical protein
MTVDIAYQKFIIKINKNATTDSISCDKGKFAVIINESQNKFIEFLLDKKYEDDIRYIQHLLVEDNLISNSKTLKVSQSFALPENYFDLSNAYAEATKGECKNKKIDLFEIKSDDKNAILRDEFNSPSFKYREAPYTLSSNSIRVYTEDFIVNSLLLSYYRKPLQIRLLNPNDPESVFDPSTYLDWDDKAADRVISLAASEFELNNGADKYQANKMNAAQKI